MPVAELARANNLDPSAKLKLGTKLTVPGAKIAASQPPVAAAPVAAAPADRGLARVAPPVRPLHGRAAAERAARAGHDRQPKRRPPRLRSKAARGHQRAADLPLAGARQGDHGLRRQDQRQVQ